MTDVRRNDASHQSPLFFRTITIHCICIADFADEQSVRIFKTCYAILLVLYHFVCSGRRRFGFSRLSHLSIDLMKAYKLTHSLIYILYVPVSIHFTALNTFNVLNPFRTLYHVLIFLYTV